MKLFKIISIAFILSVFTLSIFSQEIGIAAGVDRKSPVFNLQLGYNNNGHHVYYTQFIHTTDASNTPNILGIRYGYILNGFEPSIGADYHMLSNVKDNDQGRGWKPAFGIAYKFQRWFVGGGNTGKILYATVGIYKSL